ncbi:unnamed protein product [Phaeothamnion confervicola]
MAATTNLDESKLIVGLSETKIPQVVFIEDVEAFLKSFGDVPAETVIGAFNELYSKYKLYESSLEATRGSMKAKIPDIEKTLELVMHLKEKQQVEAEKLRVNFNLSDTVYANAEVECDGRVCIWLGANVMVEYTYEDAKAMLESNLATAKAKLESTVKDLDFLRNQSTTVEVNMARIFNFDVIRRRDQTAAVAAVGGGAAAASASAATT